MSYNETQPNPKEMFAMELAARSKSEIAIELIAGLAIAITGFGGNFLICLVICRVQSLRNISNYYVASLSLIELLLSLTFLVFLPGVILSGRWMFNDATCQFQGFITAMLATASIYAMALVAINRYFIMVKSNLHRRYFTKRNACISIVASWLLSGNFPVSYYFQCSRFEFHPGKGICVFDVNKIKLPHAILTGLLNVQIPYIIMSFCYFKIYQKVKRHNAMLKHSSRTANGTHQISANDIRITKILFAIVLAFTLCWTPFFVVDLLGVVYGQYFAPRPVYVFYSLMAGSSAAFSPILYGGFNKEVRGEIIKLFKTSFRCHLSRRAKVTSDPT